jgi:uncharacterized damage-inducible protein DinB
MTIAAALLAEFDAQAPLTRRFLERLPDETLTWKPHDKSLSAGQLAWHLATVPARVLQFSQTNPAEAPGFHFPQPSSRSEILKAHDQGVSVVGDLLPRMDDMAMNETWRLFAGGHEVLAVPRREFLRNIMFNHWYQHRGQLCVYLRLLGITVPATFGPSADEQPAFMQTLEFA